MPIIILAIFAGAWITSALYCWAALQGAVWLSWAFLAFTPLVPLIVLHGIAIWLGFPII